MAPFCIDTPPVGVDCFMTRGTYRERDWTKYALNFQQEECRGSTVTTEGLLGIGPPKQNSNLQTEL